MPIKWNAVKVSDAMDEVESQVNLTEAFLSEAKAKAEEARKIDNLPQYISQRISRLIDQLKRMEEVKNAIELVRKDIPAGAIEADRDVGKYGQTRSMM